MKDSVQERVALTPLDCVNPELLSSMSKFIVSPASMYSSPLMVLSDIKI